MSLAGLPRLCRCIQPLRTTPTPLPRLPFRPIHTARFTRPSWSPRPFQQLRFQSSGTGRSKWLRRAGYLFVGVTGVGFCVTIYGLVIWYYKLDMWPEPIRTHLRSAITAKGAKEYETSASHYEKAIDAALAMPSSDLDPDALKKLSGIYIAYAGMLQDIGRYELAYKTLKNAVELYGKGALDPEPSKRLSGDWAGNRLLTDEDHARVIGLSLSLARLALTLGTAGKVPPYPYTQDGRDRATWLDAAEYYGSGALSAALRLNPRFKKKEGERAITAPSDVTLFQTKGDLVSLGEFGGFTESPDPGIYMETLSEVYAAKKQYVLAAQLAIRAVSLLLPPDSREIPSTRNRCLAAMLMTHISSYAVQPRTPSAIKASRSWTLRSLQIANQALKDDPSDQSITLCQQATCIGLYDLGMLAEIDGDLPLALKQFEKAQAKSMEVGFNQGTREAQEAIRRVRKTKADITHQSAPESR